MTTTNDRPALPLIGIVAARLSAALENNDVLYVTADEPRAQAIAAALAAAAPAVEVLYYPSSDALPGDAAPASPGNVGQRMAALRRLRLRTGRVALITSAEGAIRPTPPPEAFDAALPVLAVGGTLELDDATALFTALGYVVDDAVDEPGEVAVRGQVVDIYPADAGAPVRIEVPDRTIAAIRRYDPVTQLGTEDLDRIEVGHAAEAAGEAALVAHLAGCAVGVEPDVDTRRRRFAGLVADSAGRVERLVDDAAWQAMLAEHPALQIATPEAAPMTRFAGLAGPLAAAARRLRAAAQDGASCVLAGSTRDLRFLAPRLAKASGLVAEAVDDWAGIRRCAPGRLALLTMPVDRGWSEPGLVVIAGADLLGSRARLDDAPAAGTAGLPLIAADLQPGDVVVHEDHGLAAVVGLELLPGETGGGEAIVLEHAGGARRLIGVEAADRLWRYGADRDAVTLDGLDGASWQKRRVAVDAQIAETARELTALAAARAERRVAVIEPEPAVYERFAARFPFNETADQARAIATVRDDFASGRPMDRLVIGDVGYGKTEVALRAAALAAFAGRQVAIAAPTTVLVRQHLETFRRRFEGTGIEIAGLSRLSSAAERKAAKAGLADGSIAIVIGTGAVAGRGVAYRDLGLVVIDEEQRFGAADKARLRGLAGDGHVLTLSATPIPRTLQAALVGLQQLSVIATPPARRQPVRTSVVDFDVALVRTALLRERSRGGQSFVVVPRIDDMATMAATLRRVVPELMLVEAHGKLPAAEIDAVMVGFAGGDGDVLLATNIIEAGLDVPLANTMVVHHADRFGLAQLHQLRGRVGRGARRGQVMLTTEPGARLADATRKRLGTLQAIDRLGAGFAVSARDLDMRGGGDLLGETQAGHVRLIGVELYQHLLEGALQAARGEVADRWMPELRLGGAGRIPDDWVPDVGVRLSLYVRLARLGSADAVDAFEAELDDRFGALPDAATLLVETARLRSLARAARIARIDAGPAAIALTPRHDYAADSAAAGLTEKNGRLLAQFEGEDAGARLGAAAAVLEKLLA